ncbi:TPA: hypothetical protein QCP59_000001, partial [Bacillus cereus]|nr:hypothetical protein [Bacillus cereus]
MKNTLLSRMEVLLDYLGLFISTFALAYFIYPNVTWAIVSGWISTFLYVCIIQFQSLQPDSTVSKKIVQFIISMFACAFIGVLCYWMKSYLTLYLDELNIYDWIIVIAFIIATTGTIIPMANKKKRPLKIMLYIILAGILILTFIKSPENISFNKKKSLNTEEILVLNKALEN